MKKIFFILVILYGFSFAHPFLNINSDEDFIYDNVLSPEKSINDITSIKPLSYFYGLLAKDKINIYLNSLEKPKIYIKPINNIQLTFYYTNADNLLIEGKSGLLLKKGINAIFYEDGQVGYKKSVVAYYQLRQILNKSQTKGKILRSYIKFIFGKLSFEVGKDNVNWGPGEYGLLMSNNAYPFPMIKLKTEKPLKFFGKWKFSILNGWLSENRKDVSNPKILGLRIVYKPFKYLEIGGTRTTMYGGDGRPSYKLTEYWDVLTSSKDNIPGDKYDNDSYAGYDISLYIPQSWFDVAKLYYEEAGTDIEAIWQEEDKGDWARRFPYIFALLSRAYKAGLFLSKGKNIFRFEYVSTPDNYYIHHWYGYEGYTYKGFSLGYPYGRDIESYLAKYIYYFNNKNWMNLRVVYYRQPVKLSSKTKTRNYIFSLEYSKVLNRYIQIAPFLRFDIKKGIDNNMLPTQFNLIDKNKSYLTAGISVFIRF